MDDSSCSPSHHSSCFISCVGYMPLHAQSVGFLGLWTHLHLSGGSWSMIDDTGFPMKVLNLLRLPRTTVLSVQKQATGILSSLPWMCEGHSIAMDNLLRIKYVCLVMCGDDEFLLKLCPVDFVPIESWYIQLGKTNSRSIWGRRHLRSKLSSTILWV